MAEAAPNPAPYVAGRTAPDGVCWLTLNRPQQRNALSVAMMSALDAALDQAAADRSVRVIVIGAEGPAFCAGHDLKEMTGLRSARDRGRAAYSTLFAQCAALMTKIVRLPKPVIAMVEGLATAAGCQLVASCDLAIASTKASFATPGVNIGLFCSTPMVVLSRNVPRKAAMEMLLTGESVSADEALRLGLVNHVVAPDAVAQATQELAAKIAAKPRRTLAIGKEAFARQAEMPLDEAYRFTAEVMARNMMEAEAEEGIGAFVAKRPPIWPV